MAKPMRNKEREKSKLLKERSLLIDAAIEDGHVLRGDISKATGLPLHTVSDTLTKNRELNAKYKIRRRTINDLAVDNIHGIIMDPKHPKNFEASKLIFGKFKNDLDETLERVDGELDIQIDSEGVVSPVKIVFGRREESKE